MSQMRATLLGTSSAQPTIHRGLSATALRVISDRVLIDCGEGTQRQMLRFGTGFRVDLVLFTHFHADHYLGIIGFLRTLAMGGRTEPLDVYGPGPFIDRLLKRLIHLGFKNMPFEINYHAIGPGHVIQRRGYQIEAVGMEHRMPCLGYVFREDRRPGRFDLEAALALGVPSGPLFGKLQRGEAISLPDGREILPEQVMGPSRPGRSMAFSGDTRPCEAFAEACRDVDLMVHEATFAEDDKARALETTHSTALEAAQVASAAGAKHLLLTHLSSRYDLEPDRLVREAAEGYTGPLTAAYDGICMEVLVEGGAARIEGLEDGDPA